jgi:hypothetical protein
MTLSRRDLPDGSIATVFDLSVAPRNVEPRDLLSPAARAESDARAAFERAVVDDFANAPEAYITWWNAHLAAGGLGIAPFGEAVQQVLVRVARERRG